MVLYVVYKYWTGYIQMHSDHKSELRYKAKYVLHN